MSKIILIGVDSSGLPDDKFRLLNQCQAVFAAKRFEPILQNLQCPIYPITPQAEAIATITELLRENKTIGMLASGDPLFFGIGQTLVNNFGKDSIEIHPALSSMQLAFARIKASWQDAYILSLHGRTEFPKTIINQQKVFLFTDKKNTPAKIALKFKEFIDQTCGVKKENQFTAVVLENLGMPNEVITQGSLSQIASKNFGDLNVMIVLSEHSETERITYRLGLKEKDIQHSRGLITKDEVRAVVLHKLKLPSTGVFWDIGAGSGSISIEAARLNPSLDIFSIEKKSEEHHNILANCSRFSLTNVNLVKGQAPEAFENLPSPDRVFIGGSGGNLSEIIEFLSKKLRKNGEIVITAVTELTRKTAPNLLHDNGFKVEISDVQVSRKTYPGTNNDIIQLNPITIITGRSNDR